jgi:hypothetical protein
MVGGWAVNSYTTPRMTGDIDFFVKVDAATDNALREALDEFGFGSVLPDSSLPLLKEDQVLMLGRQPTRIDILTNLSGVSFEDAWSTREIIKIDGLEVPILSKELLIKNKIASGRPKDLIDANNLKKT